MSHRLVTNHSVASCASRFSLHLNLHPSDLQRFTGSRYATNLTSNLYPAATVYPWHSVDLDSDKLVEDHESEIQMCECLCMKLHQKSHMEAGTRCAESAMCNNSFYLQIIPRIRYLVGGFWQRRSFDFNKWSISQNHTQASHMRVQTCYDARLPSGGLRHATRFPTSSSHHFPLWIRP